MEQMEIREDEQSSKLLPSPDKDLRRSNVAGMVKKQKWFIIFGLALLLIVVIVVSFVATKSRSRLYECTSYTGGDECFFVGDTRLPKTLNPETYKLHLQTNLSTFEFSGSVVIVIKCLEATDRVVFHQKGLTFEETSISELGEGKPGSKAAKNVIKIEKQVFDDKNEQVISKIAGRLEKGKEYSITVKFLGKLNDKLEGFYKSSYKTKRGELRYLATTHFEATAARQAFPCFDEPAMKAKFTISMTHATKYLALSNMPVKERRSQTHSEEIARTDFEESVKMSTYLVAFIVCDYKSKSKSIPTDATEVRVWAPPEQIDEGQLALDSAIVILPFYGKYFGVKYPLPKADLIAIPDFSAGAMENWGLITYRLTSLLTDKQQSSSSNMQWVVTVVAHELAHQWFGNLVTMKWWDDLWLNEGFASYMETVGVNEFKPQWKMKDQFLANNIQRSMVLDQLASSHPISVVVNNPSEISSLFDDISYHKGASLINMINNVLGEGAFLYGLQSYLKKYAYGNAVTADLWNSLSENTTVNVKDVMDTWTLQMGFPLVTIKKLDDGSFLASQEHFLVNPETKPTKKSPFNYKWHIPFNYRTDSSNKSSKIHMMKLGDIQFDVQIGKDGWLKANHKQFGFYRVNYPDENWKNLVKTLNVNHKKLSAADRSGLIDDAFALARAGKLSYTIPLDMSLYLDKEEEYVPWVTALRSLMYLGSRLSMTPYYGLYQKYILSKVTPVLNNVLKYEDIGEHLERYLRDILFGKAVFYDYEPALNVATKMFNGYMYNNTSVPPNYRNVVYDTGVRKGGLKEWEFMWHKYNTELVASEKSKLLSSLTSTQAAWLLERLLQYSLDTSVIKSQDADTVISLVAGNANGRLLAWDFLREHWPTLLKRYGSESFSMGRLIAAVAAHFQKESRLKEVQTFFSTNSNVGAAKRSITQVLETIQTNIRWVKNHENEVVQWLKEHQ